ncbi:cation:dicarboxylate symporter family transporter [Candidatus Williamhamiltonella defendens]|uniref:cation:dicarboxylate symporter family transporter n=1 Tax=Candidatus Williamhamiltonella defendens TaxID=138072 RepID=UPI001F327315|nr:cation:dicarboxylase symporter family transporter [Candidatus Hamiltonella defensa]
MTKIVATTDVHHILKSGHFVIASYVGLGMIFLVHALLLFLSGVAPRKFFRHAWPVFTFAFTIHYSTASISLNIEVATHRLRVSESIANFFSFLFKGEIWVLYVTKP